MGDGDSFRAMRWAAAHYRLLAGGRRAGNAAPAPHLEISDKPAPYQPVPRASVLVVSCEHGGNRIPPRYRPLFGDCEALLRSHRGYDPGALAMAREIARAWRAPLFVATTSRLLVDLNRSPGHPRLHGEAVRRAPAAVRQEIVARYYRPYRHRAERRIADTVAQGHRVVHISSHSFTPVLDGKTRNADIGLLYDPGRPGEKALCAAWRAALRRQARDLKVRLNYPYAGRSDGFTAYLRRRFPAERYIGVELEINQRLLDGPAQARRELRRAIVESLRRALGEMAPPLGDGR